MSEPIRVLFLDHTAQLSGGEIALLRVLEAIDRSVVTPIVVLADDGPLVEKLRAAGVETEVAPLSAAVREVRKDSLTLGSSLGRLKAPLLLVRYAATVAAIARRRRAQVIHTNSLKADFYGALAGRLARVPVVWHIRDHIDTSYLPGLAVKAVRTLARSVPAYVVTNSQSTLDHLFLDGSRQRYAVVHDGIAVGAPPAERPWSDPPRIGLIGRITSWKGQHVFLDAAAKVRAAGVDARYEIVGKALFGEADYDRQVREQATRLGLDDCVAFVGFSDDVPGLLRSLDLLVHASISPEPFGQVVIEGMAEGVPVIGTNGGGVREIVVDGENGLLVPMGDSDAMAAAILALLRDPARARALGKAGYQRVAGHFTSALTARKLERVFQDLLGR